MLLPRSIGWWNKEKLERRLTPTPSVLNYMPGRERRQEIVLWARVRLWAIEFKMSPAHFTFITSYVYMPYLCLVRHAWLYTVRWTQTLQHDFFRLTNWKNVCNHQEAFALCYPAFYQYEYILHVVILYNALLYCTIYPYRESSFMSQFNFILS